MFSSFFDPLKKLQNRCKKTLDDKKLPDDLKELYAVSLPQGNCHLYDLKICSLDFETTGLNFAYDHILSIGGIALDHLGIDFSTAFHHILRNTAKVRKETAVINMLTPEVLERGEDPQKVTRKLARDLAGKVIICHCATIEYNFLKKSLGLSKQHELPMIFLDTMAIERSLFGESRDARFYSLNLIRQRRGLPTYNAHNALADSIATAELFMVQIKDIFANKTPILGELYKRSH